MILAPVVAVKSTKNAAYTNGAMVGREDAGVPSSSITYGMDEHPMLKQINKRANFRSL